MRFYELDFKLRLLSPTLTGEDSKTSEYLCRLLSIVDDANLCRKVIIQHRNYRFRAVLRASSIRGLLRSASEYVIETVSRRHFNRVAVCTFLDYEDRNRKPGMPLCKLPLDPSDDRRLIEYLRSIVELKIVASQEPEKISRIAEKQLRKMY